MAKSALDEIVDVIREKNNFLITSHVNPEGDSIGSLIAMFLVLEKMGKKAVMGISDKVPENLKFLPGADRIRQELDSGFSPDVAIVLDCPVIERVGWISNFIDESTFIINIDHHISNSSFANINWVEPDSSSVGEILYELFKKLKVDIDTDIAKAVYTAIITDTGGFNYDNTSKRTHMIAGELLEYGIRPRIMQTEIFEKKELAQLRVLGKALLTIELIEEGKIAVMSLKKEMYAEEGSYDISTEDFINYPRSIKGVEVTILFKENIEVENSTSISFRSTGAIDVNELALKLGGGGHKQASGCTLRIHFNDAKARVLEEAVKHVRGI